MSARQTMKSIIGRIITYRLMLLFFMIIASVLVANAENYPAQCRVKTNLNIRSGAGTHYRKIGKLYKGSTVVVNSTTYANSRTWGIITYGNQTGYIALQYVEYIEPIDTTPKAEPVKAPTPSKGFNLDFVKNEWLKLLIYAIIGLVVITLLRAIALNFLYVFSKVMYYVYWIICIPFYILNWLQRYLSKPWRLFYKTNNGNDRKNQSLRSFYEYIKVPLYVLLTPLRLVNAIYYNMIVHCCFEFYNLIIEVLSPANSKEGANNFFLMLILIPWRLIRYVLFHGSLTLIESAIWTIIDTFVPALTLFHGTDYDASVSITNAGRCGDCDYYTGIWNVGGGNYAGNGIYFAPARSTAIHYSRGSLIVCRVSLGKVLDLGLAPYNIYRQCGYPNATGATDWGLRHGYTTGEWWRGDYHANWWEYCMYDWQERYNFSWRIRPLYVLDMNEKRLQRIPGGMCHWLFREMVIKDILTSINKSI